MGSSFFFYLNPLVHTTKISQEFLYLWPEDCELLNISFSLPSSHPKQRKWPFGTMGQNNGDQFKCSVNICSWWSLSDILCVFDCTCIYMTSKKLGQHNPSSSHLMSSDVFLKASSLKMCVGECIHGFLLEKVCKSVCGIECGSCNWNKGHHKCVWL